MIIGRGEHTACKIFEKIFGLDTNDYHQWGTLGPRNGIHLQVPLPALLSDKWNTDLAPLHVKSSVDILVVTEYNSIAVYVNGKEHAGAVKAKRDEMRYKMLRDTGHTVLVLPIHECPRLFREEYSIYSMAEVFGCLAGIKGIRI